MELRHLRYFVALAECLNFTRAAERVHVTQSTLSHQIRQLEEEIGQPLFARAAGKRVAMTEAGQLFVAFAQRSLNEVDHGIAMLRPAADGTSGRVRIGATHTFNISLIPECVAQYLARHPTTRVHVEELAADEIGARLHRGELDIGIAYKPSTATDLHFEPLFHEEMVLVVAADHLFAARRRIRMVELHQRPLVLLPAYFATRGMLEECFAASGAEPTIVAEMSTVAPMLGLVLRTEVAAIVSANAVPPGMSGLKMIPIESPTPVRTPGLLWKTGVPMPPPVRSFAVVVRKAAVKGSRKPQRR
jgi:LysR family cyn operon transcriptional activator